MQFGLDILVLLHGFTPVTPFPIHLPALSTLPVFLLLIHNGLDFEFHYTLFGHFERNHPDPFKITLDTSTQKVDLFYFDLEMFEHFLQLN